MERRKSSCFRRLAARRESLDPPKQKVFVCCAKGESAQIHTTLREVEAAKRPTITRHGGEDRQFAQVDKDEGTKDELFPDRSTGISNTTPCLHSQTTGDRAPPVRSTSQHLLPSPGKGHLSLLRERQQGGSSVHRKRLAPHPQPGEGGLDPAVG